MRVNLDTCFVRGSYKRETVPDQVTVAVADAITLILGKTHYERELIESIESLDLQFAGGPFAPDLETTITVVDHDAHRDKLAKYVVVHSHRFRFGESVIPSITIAHDILDAAAKALERTRRARESINA